MYNVDEKEWILIGRLNFEKNNAHRELIRVKMVCIKHLKALFKRYSCSCAY